jgi:hypothetical protein
MNEQELKRLHLLFRSKVQEFLDKNREFRSEAWKEYLEAIDVRIIEVKEDVEEGYVPVDAPPARRRGPLGVDWYCHKLKTWSSIQLKDHALSVPKDLALKSLVLGTLP